MPRQKKAPTPRSRNLPPQQAEVLPLIQDAEELTPRELEQECKAMTEELKNRSWMDHSAEQLAERIPTSIFAMGSIAAAANDTGAMRA